MKALVTGGGGFLGKAIVHRLVNRGDSVRSFSRGSYPELTEMGVEHVQGDIADKDAVSSAVAGCDLVFHVAAKPGISVRYQDFYVPNVVGTDKVLAACREHRVRRLVYTSSPSVVFDGTDMEGVDESVPYPKSHIAPYPATKAIAEQMVLAANCSELATVALRPHLIWGPGDNHLVPRLLDRARSGRLRRIGKTNKLIDAVYIDNAADSHILAADRLTPGSSIAGKAYFISQGEPVPIWDLINDILATVDLPPVTKVVPLKVAYTVGWLLESVYWSVGSRGEPPMTRFLAKELATAHWFDLSAAKRDLGYDPKVTTIEGLGRLKEYLRALVP
ncbi:MAG: NAD-dependent epimerase/dehydratase family protein [Gemmataceae bacterium]